MKLDDQKSAVLRTRLTELEISATELTEQRDIYRDRCQQLTESARAAGENWMSAVRSLPRFPWW